MYTKTFSSDQKNAAEKVYPQTMTHTKDGDIDLPSLFDTVIAHGSDVVTASLISPSGHISASYSLGVGIRVISSGCWGFAATDDLTPEGLQSAARLAVDIARSGVLAKKRDVVLAPEDAHRAVWVSPCGIDPFGIPVDENLRVLFAVDAAMRQNPAITMAEAAKVLGAAIGKPGLGYTAFPGFMAKPALTQMGLSKSIADGLIEMSEAINDRRMVPVEKRSAANSTPTSLEWFAENVFAPTVLSFQPGSVS